MIKKVCSIVFILILGLGFLFYNHHKESFVAVVRIESPANFVLSDDKNVNLGIDVLSFKNKSICKAVAQNMKLSYDDVLAVGYLADKYAEEYLLGKNIVVDEYIKAIKNSGFVINNNLPVNPEKFRKQLDIARKTNFVIYNVKSHKYHRLSCKYGNLASNYSIIPKSELKKDAFPCRYCFKQLSSKNQFKESRQQVIKVPPLVFSSKYIKILLADYTTNLKPSDKCVSQISKELLSLINNSHKTIDIAVYGYDRVPEIEKALSNAIKRGVKVRLVYDTDLNGGNIYLGTDILTKLIPVSNTDKNNAIMHDKFYIFDSKVVMTGSANLSPTDMSGFNSNAVIVIKSPAVAKIYEQEFNQMINSSFHDAKSIISSKHNIILGDSVLSVYFSPADDTIHKAIIPLIHSAKKYIYIPAFLITERDMTNALIAAKHRGVDVKVIVDAVNAKGKASKHKILRNNGILVKTENYAGKLHSKSIIIDDTYVVIGSMNFSYSGNFKNDENVIILKNPAAAKFYREFFVYLWGRIYNFWLNHDVAAESIYSIGSCSDGVDNDFDGKIDKNDEGCIKNK